ncbi:fibronectin type III domain-containing protein [Streptomyces sp. NPDC005385]|uniref:fibronectin type III domain-containing protein n=1 Tax=Streptomyces sp. NPDC005385 TaxID=3157039 RepID=UPI00339F5D3D
MSVNQVHEALGAFEFELLGNVPRDVLDSIQYFSHIAIIPGRLDPRQYGDGCLSAARYVGVVRGIKIADDGRTNLVEDDIRISGVGMEFWLGDDDGKGAVIETPVEFTAASFSTVMNNLRPSSVSNGTLYAVSGSYTGRHVYETPRNAIKYVCDTLSTTAVPVGYRVTNDAKLNAGPESSLFVTNPTCIIMRKGGTQGEDVFTRALPSTVNLDQDMEDFSTRVVMLAESDGDSFVTGAADIGTVSPGTNVYKDMFGNALALTRLVSESDTVELNANARAEIALRSVIDPHRTLTLATQDYDIHGSFETGDYVWVYDPDAGLVDTANEVVIRGVRINPLKLRVTEAEWPITEGYTVALRSANGTWSDLTDYIHWEDSTTAKVVVGDYARNLTDSAESVANRLGAVSQPDSTVPAAPAWVPASFQTTTYLDANGYAKARQKLVWSQPLNADGTGITDGSHYEVQFRLDSGAQFSQTWADLSALHWDQLNTWDAPIVSDSIQWQSLFVGWDQTSLVIHELATGTAYDFRIRAVDTSANAGNWSVQQTITTREDDIPPSTPAAPVVAANLVSIQVTHSMGKASGGTYNLENDLAHLEVHYSYDNGFTPSDATKAGLLRANQGLMSAQVPTVGSFTIAETQQVYVKVVAVDLSGNRSSPSAAATATAELIDDEHITSLTVSKLLAGTISADWILGANIRTNDVGARIELGPAGLAAYNADGVQTVDIGSDGDVSLIGRLSSGVTGRRIDINPADATNPEIRLYPDSGGTYAYIRAYDTDYGDPQGNPVILSSNEWTGLDDSGMVHTYESRLWMASGPIAGATIEGLYDGSVATDLTVATGYIQMTNTTFDGLTITSAALSEYGFNVFGGLYSDNLHVGRFTAPTVMNTIQTTTITGFGLKSGTYRAFVTADSTAPQNIEGLTVGSVSNDAITVYTYRESTADTNVNYMVIEEQ